MAVLDGKLSCWGLQCFERLFVLFLLIDFERFKQQLIPTPLFGLIELLWNYWFEPMFDWMVFVMTCSWAKRWLVNIADFLVSI